jgi:ABC-2 type transport system permease protein
MKGIKTSNSIVRWALIIVAIVLVNVMAQTTFYRFDLTAEKRFSLNPVTKNMLQKLEDPVLIKFYLDGEMPSGFLRLQREALQMLNEFRAIHRRIEVEIIDPNDIPDRKERSNLMEQLQTLGLSPIQIEMEDAGNSKRITLYPGAIMSYGEKQMPVQLLSGQINMAPEAQINTAIQNLEYTWANALRALSKTQRASIGFVQGLGQLSDRKVADIIRTLSLQYDVSRVDLREFPADSTSGELSLNRQLQRVNRYDAIVIAKPSRPFTDMDKFLIDQFLMNGGKILWCIDPVFADMDSLSNSSEMLAFPMLDEMRISDMLFRYGVRLNTNLVLDKKSSWLSDIQRARPWIYWPLVSARSNHPIAKDLNAIKIEFVSSIDTVMAEGISKTPLLFTSSNCKIVPTPHVVSLEKYYNFPKDEIFANSFVPIAYLLEGEFESIFANRLIPKYGRDEDVPFVSKGKKTAQVVIADGDIIKNQVNITNPNIEKGLPLPLGFDQFTGIQYGNKDFLLNAFDYLLDTENLIQIRSRELKIRLLDASRVREQRNLWIVLNTVLPLVLLVAIGLINTLIRRKKFARKA